MEVRRANAVAVGWRQVVAALYIVAGPAVVALLLFTGRPVATCLGLGPCRHLEPSVVSPQPIDVDLVLRALVGFGISWLISVILTIRFLCMNDRGRLVRATLGWLAIVGGTVALVGLVRLSEGRRLRVVAEDAALYGLGIAIVLIPLALSWAVLTARRRETRPAELGGPSDRDAASGQAIP